MWDNFIWFRPSFKKEEENEIDRNKFLKNEIDTNKFLKDERSRQFFLRNVKYIINIITRLQVTFKVTKLPQIHFH